jgi:phosphatidylglycerol---prolipoprotein diacylglyceryl transferase
VTFPGANPPDGRASPPFAHQREHGELWGFRVKPGADEQGVVAAWVEGDGAASRAGLRAGRVIRAINGHTVTSVVAARQVLGNATPDIALETDDGTVRIALGQFPARSRPVHPSQIYASINAALLCLLLWAYYPFRRRDGEVFAIMLTLYPITRVLEEIIRTDEPGRFGTPLTISQWVSVVLLVTVGALWMYLSRQPRGSVLPAADLGPTQE